MSQAETSAGCRAPSQVLGGLSGRGKPCDPEARGTGPLLRTFSTQERAVTKRRRTVTSSAGWNLPAFPARKRNPEHGERLEPDFDRKRANLEAQAPRLTSDTKKRTFQGVGRFERLLHQKRSGDEAVTSLVTSSAG